MPPSILTGYDPNPTPRAWENVLYRGPSYAEMLKTGAKGVGEKSDGNDVWPEDWACRTFGILLNAMGIFDPVLPSGQHWVFENWLRIALGLPRGLPGPRVRYHQAGHGWGHLAETTLVSEIIDYDVTWRFMRHQWPTPDAPWDRGIPLDAGYEQWVDLKGDQHVGQSDTTPFRTGNVYRFLMQCQNFREQFQPPWWQWINNQDDHGRMRRIRPNPSDPQAIFDVYNALAFALDVDPSGMITANEVARLLHGRRPVQQVERALATLVDLGVAEVYDGAFAVALPGPSTRTLSRGMKCPERGLRRPPKPMRGNPGLLLVMGNPSGEAVEKWKRFHQKDEFDGDVLRFEAQGSPETLIGIGRLHDLSVKGARGGRWNEDALVGFDPDDTKIWIVSEDGHGLDDLDGAEVSHLTYDPHEETGKEKAYFKHDFHNPLPRIHVISERAVLLDGGRYYVDDWLYD